MGQVLFKDSIGQISLQGSNIQLDNALVSIGGQQYSFNTVQEPLPSLTANTLYFVYAVVTANVPALEISTNVNSVGPAGFNSWVLVGAFYSDGLSSVGFGSFVNIDGNPKSGWIKYEATLFNEAWVGASPDNQEYAWKNNGDGTADMSGNFRALSNGNSASLLGIGIPNTLTLDIASLPQSTHRGEARGRLRGSLQPITIHLVADFANQDRFTLAQDGGSISSLAGAMQVGDFGTSGGRTDFLSFIAHSIPIEELSSTPLKDL